MAVSVVVFNNTFREMFDTPTMNTTAVAAGVRLYGHRYVLGYEANWYTLVDANTLDCTTQFLVYSDNIEGVVFSLGQVVRENRVLGGVSLALDFVWDSLMEANAFAGGRCAYNGVTSPAGTTLYNASSPNTLVR